MAVYRQIQVSYWQDPFVISLTPEEKYFYIYLMTNSKTTQCGIYELPKKVMEFETGYNRESVDKLMERFIQYGKVLYHDLTQELMLLNWMKHNSMKSPKVRSCVEKELRSIKNKDYKYRFASLCKDYGYPIDRLCIDSGEEEEKEEEKEKEKKEEQEQEKAEDSRPPVPVFGNPLNSQIIEFLKKYEVTHTILDLDNLESFIGLMDMKVIEHCIGKSEGKSGSYAVSILQRLAKEGKTTIEQVRPAPKVTKIDYKRSGKPDIDVAHTDSSQVVSDAEFEEMMRMAQEIQEHKHNPGA